MSLLWITIISLTLPVMGAMLWPLLKRHNHASLRSSFEVKIYSDQLKEIDADVARGALSEAEAEAARLDIQRRLLRANKDSSPQNPTLEPPWLRLMTLGVVMVGLPLSAIGLYLNLGQPKLPSQPLSHRQAEQADIAAMSATEQAKMIQNMVEGLAARLQETPQDGEGWARLGRAYAVLDQWTRAAEAYGRAISLLPQDDQLFAAHGVALLQSNPEVKTISAAAETEFRRALALNPNNGDALWYIGVAEIQAGRPKLALEHWQKLLIQLDPSSPEYRDIWQAIQLAKARANIN